MCLFTKNEKFCLFSLLKQFRIGFRYNLKRLIRSCIKEWFKTINSNNPKSTWKKEVTYDAKAVETYLAKHATDKQHYLLKKVNIREQNDRKKYQILIN